VASRTARPTRSRAAKTDIGLLSWRRAFPRRIRVQGIVPTRPRPKMATTRLSGVTACTTPSCGSAASAACASRPPSRPASRAPTLRKNFPRIMGGCVVSAGAAPTSCMRGSVLSPGAATVVDLPEARMSEREGGGGSTRRLHYRASCESNDPRTEAQRSASTAKATRRRSRSAFHIFGRGERVDPLRSEPRVVQVLLAAAQFFYSYQSCL
jgi:hypothetical protein